MIKCTLNYEIKTKLKENKNLDLQENISIILKCHPNSHF